MKNEVIKRIVTSIVSGFCGERLVESGNYLA